MGADRRPVGILRALLREPLAQFALVSLGLVAIEAGVRERAERPASTAVSAATAAAPGNDAPAGDAVERRLVVDGEVRDRLRDRFTRAEGRAPTADELAAAEARWIEDEILYREALARGLDRGDPAVRQRLARKMAFVLERQVDVAEPSEEELRAHFAAHRARWASPERIDFTHVYVAGDGAAAEARAAALRARLEAGASPATLGDRFSGGRRYRGRTPAALAARFGDAFAGAVAAQAPGGWTVQRSRHGWHVVRVDRHEPARPGDFGAARLEVLAHWRDARRAERLTEAVDAVRGRWQVVRR